MANKEFDDWVNQSEKEKAEYEKSKKEESAKLGGEKNIDIQKLAETVKTLQNEVKNSQAEKQSLEKKNKELAKHNEAITNKLDSIDDDNNEQAVNDVVKGFTETFKKSYDFPVDGGKDIKFDIELKPLSAVGLARLQQEVVRLSNGQNRFFDDIYQELMEAISLFQMDDITIKCPEWLKEESSIYRIDIPVTIYREYVQWLESFRKRQQF